MSEIEVKTADLQVGDVITGCKLPGSKAWNPLTSRTVLSEPKPDPRYPSSYEFDLLRNDDGHKYKEFSGSLLFRVQRKKVKNAEPLASVFGCEDQPKIIDEFPGKCPRCGRQAYVGSFEVTHKNEASAKDCPARRG